MMSEFCTRDISSALFSTNRHHVASTMPPIFQPLRKRCLRKTFLFFFSKKKVSVSISVKPFNSNGTKYYGNY